MRRLLLGMIITMFGIELNARAATLPVAATDVAASWDSLYWFLIWLSLVFFVGIVVAMIVFAVKYRKDVNKKPKYIHGHTGLEVVWTVIPTILVLIIFAWGWAVYRDMIHPPADAMEVHVIGKQWSWQFSYSNGNTSVRDLYVPLNKPVKLIMSSEDVIHSMFIPNFRVKQDVVPGMYSHVWFESKVPGIHQIFCTEYCGTDHSAMLGRVIVLTAEQWKEWWSGKKIDVDSLPSDPSFPGYRANFLGEGLPADAAQAQGLSLAEKGKKLYETRTCSACHSTDGSAKVGPTFKGLYGSDVKLIDGTTVKADDNYIHESIVMPAAKVVDGFGPVSAMPMGLVTSEDEINQLVEFIKSLK